MIDEIIQKAVEHPKTVIVIVACIGLALLMFSDWDKHDDDTGMFV